MIDARGSDDVQMEDLSLLVGETLTTWWGHASARVFGHPPRGVADGPGSFAGRDYRNAIRLTDKALGEWELARQKLREYADRESNTTTANIRFFHSINHFENSINAMHRACILLDHLKREPDVPLSKNDLLRPVEVRRIGMLRHASEHIDDFVRSGEVPPEADLFIRPWCEGLTFVGDRLEYATLSRWLRKLHDQAMLLVNHAPEN